MRACGVAAADEHRWTLQVVSGALTRGRCFHLCELGRLAALQPHPADRQRQQSCADLTLHAAPGASARPPVARLRCGSLGMRLNGLTAAVYATRRWPNHRPEISLFGRSKVGARSSGFRTVVRRGFLPRAKSTAARSREDRRRSIRAAVRNVPLGTQCTTFPGQNDRSAGPTPHVGIMSL